MIDGVNITGCTWCDFEPDAEPYCRINDGEDLACEDNPNCYYKQLARKKQELETICKAFDIEYGYDEETGAIVGRCNKLIEKEKVLEEYKQSLDEKNKFLQDLGISASGEFKRIKFYIEDLKNKYNEKVEECEELKEENQQLRNNLSDSLMFRFTSQDKQINHYRKALDEIEGIAKNFGSYAAWQEQRINKILDIINKAKGEGNEDT